MSQQQPPQQPQAPRVDNRPNANVPAGNPTRARETVTVACKVSVPWIDLQLCKPMQVSEQTMNGSKEVTMFYKDGPVIRIRGTAYPVGQTPEGFPEKPERLFGYALTRNIPKDWWDEFTKQYAKWPYLQNGLVYAFANLDDGRAQAKEQRAFTSGLEPINPKGDPRSPRPISEGMDPIETEEHRAKKMAAAKTEDA